MKLKPLRWLHEDGCKTLVIRENLRHPNLLVNSNWFEWEEAAEDYCTCGAGMKKELFGIWGRLHRHFRRREMV